MVNSIEWGAFQGGGAPLFSCGLLIILAYLAGRTSNRIGLPKVTGYLVAGILIGPNVMGLLGADTTSHGLRWISDVALSLIGFSIGGSLELNKLKRMGQSVLWITLFQAIGALVLVTAGMFIMLSWWGKALSLGEDAIFPLSLTTGAICIATAPGAVVAVLTELKARGRFTDILLGVVALDDGVTIIVFAAVMAFVQWMLSTDTTIALSSFYLPIWEICASVVLGTIVGLCSRLLLARVYNKGSILMVLLGSLILITAISPVIHCSPILTSMSFGAAIVNWESRHNLFFSSTDDIEDLVFGLFFGLTGAHMDFGILVSVWHLSLVMLVLRFLGKQLGVSLGGKLTDAPENVKKYLGIGLFPQAGVTIGLVFLAAEYFQPRVGNLLINFVVGSVILNEMIAPPLLKLGIRKVGDVTR